MGDEGEIESVGCGGGERLSGAPLRNFYHLLPRPKCRAGTIFKSKTFWEEISHTFLACRIFSFSALLCWEASFYHGDSCRNFDEGINAGGAH